MLGSYLDVFGPNPVTRNDNPSRHRIGHQDSGVQIKFRYTFDADFAGFASVAKALVEKTGEFIDENTRGAN